MTPVSSPAGQVQLGSRRFSENLVRLTTDSAPEYERPARLHAFFDRLGVRYEAEHIGTDPIAIGLILQGLPGLQIMSGRMQGGRYRRTRESNDPTEDFSLIVNPGGSQLLSQRGREIVLGDGEAALVALTDPLITMHRPPGSLLVLRFPVSQLAARLGEPQDCVLRRIPRGSPALGLLIGYVDVVGQDTVLADVDLQHTVVSHFYDLLAVTIGATRGDTAPAKGRGVRAARLHAIKQDISRDLAKPDLSAATLAARHACTPRQVQRLFEREGTTLTAYLMEQRLERAHRLLSDPARAGEKISTIALDAGFADVSYFNRAFRRRYGDSPTAIRALRSGHH